MKYIIYFFAIVLLLALNLGFFSHLKFFGAVPNLLFLAVLCFTLESEVSQAVFFGLLAGFFLDFNSPGFFGTFSLPVLFALFFVRFLKQHFAPYELNWKIFPIFVICGFICFFSVQYFFALFAFAANLSPFHPDFVFFLRQSAFILAYSLVFLYFINSYVKFMNKIIFKFFSRRPAY